MNCRKVPASSQPGLYWELEPGCFISGVMWEVARGHWDLLDLGISGRAPQTWEQHKQRLGEERWLETSSVPKAITRRWSSPLDNGSLSLLFGCFSRSHGTCADTWKIRVKWPPGDGSRRHLKDASGSFLLFVSNMEPQSRLKMLTKGPFSANVYFHNTVTSQQV